MLTLPVSMLGFLSSAFPELLTLFWDSQGRKQEVAFLDHQMKQQRLRHALVRCIAGLGAPGHHLCIGLCGGESLGLAHLATTEGITVAPALQATWDVG